MTRPEIASDHAGRVPNESSRTACESDRTTRLHFESLASDYERLAELADRNAQLDLIYKKRRPV